MKAPPADSPNARWRQFRQRYDVKGEEQMRHPELRVMVEGGDGEGAAYELGLLRERERAWASTKPPRVLTTGGTELEKEVARFVSQMAGNGGLCKPVSTEVHLPERLASKPWAVPVIVSALPHVEPESVAANYSSARRTLLESFRGDVSVRRIVMADFVNEEERREKRKLSGPERLERWNAAAPRGWRYDDWRTMVRAYGHEMKSPRNAYEEGPGGARGREYRGYMWE